VAAGLGDDVDQATPDLVRERLELIPGQPLDVRRTGDRLKERQGALSVGSRDNVVRQLRQRRRS
jgi:hypothetical protein